MQIPAVRQYQSNSSHPRVSFSGQKLQESDVFKPRLDTAKMPGHWLLARLGKRVLRPGGLETTRAMLDSLQVGPTDQVVEFAPGLGMTAAMALEKNPRSYVGVERDADAIALLQDKLAAYPAAEIRKGKAQETDLPDASATVVYGEAMLSMHDDRAKRAIVQEAFRILKPGGRYGIHELALQFNQESEAKRQEIGKALKDSIRVNAQPLTAAEWKALLEDEGFEVMDESTFITPMHLLEPKRMVQDEGLLGTLKIIGNVLRDSAARKRVLQMRSVFSCYQPQLRGISMVAVKPAEVDTAK